MNPHNGAFAMVSPKDETTESWWLDKDRAAFYREVHAREPIWIRRGRHATNMTETWLLDEPRLKR